VINPAQQCGLVGLRPTFGRISRYGSLPGEPTMGKVGILGRSVEDCAAVFAAIHGPDGHDWAVVDRPFAWEPRTDLAGMRIGVIASEYEALQDQTDRTIFDQAYAVLQALGAGLEPIELPFPPLMEEVAWLTNWIEGPWGDPEGAKAWGEDNMGRLLTGEDYLWIQRARTGVCRALGQLFNHVDLLIYPGDGSRPMWATNWTGLPALQVPSGFTHGLPRGMVFVARAYDEGSLLRAAFAYEQATPWHTHHPSLAAGGAAVPPAGS
jgi:Asp-tRNA(Asn)/Glu-tRNA(Gln) amidotransferase A subunit family amidase